MPDIHKYDGFARDTAQEVYNAFQGTFAILGGGYKAMDVSRVQRASVDAVHRLPSWFFAPTNQTSEAENLASVWGAAFSAAVACLEEVEF